MTEKEDLPVRAEDGKFLPGKSGNPAGRPKGSKNQITILKQSLELMLREQAAPDMAGVLDKAIELAKEGNVAMIKLLLEMHMSKGVSDDKEAKEKLAIQINTGSPAPAKQPDARVIDVEDYENE